MSLNNVPQSGQNLQNTRDPIRGNFNVIDTAFTVDHVTYNTTGAGWHNKVTFPVQGSTPTFAAGNNGFYSLVRSGVNEVYIHKQTAAGTADIPMTASFLSLVTPTNQTPGWTYLPSGILVKWNSTTVTNTPSFPVNIPNGGATSGPAFTALFTVVPWVGSSIAFFYNGVSGTNQFHVTANPGGIVYYLAIGM